MRQENFRRNFKLQLDSTPRLIGLDSFTRTLEKDYFSKVSLRSNTAKEGQWNLVLELDCNFTLVEILFYMQKGNWGNSPSAGSLSLPPLNRALQSLRDLNLQSIDIEEIALFLKDTSITIKKIYEQSVEEQFATILQTIAEHYVHFTKKLTETPYEIYIPVFEEEVTEVPGLLSKVNASNTSRKDYFGFWGLYFDSEEDAVIYDLGNKSIISGDLYMLNH